MAPKLAMKKKEKTQEKKLAPTASSLQIAREKAIGDADILDQLDDGVWCFMEEREDLTEEELKKDVTLILKAADGFVGEDLVEFSFKDSEYRPLVSSSDVIEIYSQTGTMVYKDSKEKTSSESGSTDKINIKRKNKFNFCDRAVQSMNFALRDEALQTDMPPSSKYAGNATLWDMTSLYEEANRIEEVKAQETNEERICKKFPQLNKEKEFEISLLVMKQTERMVNQNRFAEVILDFGFYDNPCDEFVDQGIGTLLPLWKFSFKEMKKVPITGLSWNPLHTDMFAAAYGMNKVSSRNRGCICIYSLKCPSYVEKTYTSEVAVQCLEFCKTCPYLLAAGFVDGTVAVYDLRITKDEHLAKSQKKQIEHNDVVSQIKWLSLNVEMQNNFCSVSADGRVINWCLAGKELVGYEITGLKITESNSLGLDGGQTKSTSGGTSISFNNNSTENFLVGTEEGIICKCSTLYSTQFLQTYKDHSNVVYNVEWNHYHPRVFLSCSADWTIRIWDHTLEKSVFLFDMTCEVKAASWASFSSTLFAAVTKDGKVHVFDLMMNRQVPICTYTVYVPKKNINLTFVSFNPKLPVLIVGDDRGAIISFKLSPNLRGSLKSLSELDHAKFVASEIDKMEKVLKIASSPAESTVKPP